MKPNRSALRMPTDEKEVLAARSALLCVADAGLAEQLARELKLCAHVGCVSVAANLTDLIERMEHDAPCVILQDDDVFQEAPLSELLRQLTKTAPVILLAAAERQAEILRMVAGGEVEFVAPWGICSTGRLPGRAAHALGPVLGIVRRIALDGNAGRCGGNFSPRDQQSAYGDTGQRGVIAFAWCAVACSGHTAITDCGRSCGAVTRDHSAVERRLG
jgi:hypothetical protein